MPKIEPQYALLPTPLLLPPAVRHRRSIDRTLLRPFEFAIAAALLRLARNTVAQYRHDSRLKIGAAAIAQEVERGNRHRRNLQQTGSAGYAITDGRAIPVPELIPITISRRGLLLAGGLVARPSYFHQLFSTIDRLTKPVYGMPVPLLHDGWRPWRDRLELYVSGYWLRPPFQRVPLPLPLREHTLALFLFLHAINTSPLNQRGIQFVNLCGILGIAPENRHRSLSRAIDDVNRHLGKHPYSMVKEYHANVDGSYVRFSRRIRQDNPELEAE